MKKPLKRSANVTIKTLPSDRVIMRDPGTGILINPAVIDIGSDYKKNTFSGLWLGMFDLTYNDCHIVLDTTKKGLIKEGDLIYSVSHHWILKSAPEQLMKVFVPIYLRLFRFGWNYTFKISNVISVCQYLNKKVRKNLKKSGSVIPIPVDTSDFPKKLKDLRLKHPSVLLIQNHQIKQKSEALVNFDNVVKKLPDVTFYISRGLPENQNEHSKKVIETLDGNNNVHFININSSNKYDYLNSCDIYALVSGLDCTPATILEASIAKKPIVASAVGGVPEMIANGVTGYCLNNNDILGWVESIKKLTNDHKLRSKMGRDAYKRVIENYEIKIISKILLEEVGSPQ